MDCVIWLVTYEGQTESAYTWSEYDWHSAERLKEQLEKEFPDRVWDICEKDVS
jgi:hypothetical protein